MRFLHSHEALSVQLGARRHAPHGSTDVPADVARRGDAARGEEQGVGGGRRVGDRGPVVPAIARAAQVRATADVACANEVKRGFANVSRIVAAGNAIGTGH